MVAGSNPARGAKFRLIINGLHSDSDLTCDLVAADSQVDVYGGTVAAAAVTPNRLNSNRASQRRAFTELIPMRDIQVDRSQLAPSILPAEIPELSDDECLARLARAVETPESARLDEVAALIGRLAVAIE
jgi:spore germination cell wall hydrolase CwlJ-like protein